MAHLGPTLRRTRRRERPWLRALLAAVISLVLNVLALTQLDATWLGLGRFKEVRPVELAPLAASDWEANRTVRDGSRAAPRSTPPPAPPAPPPPPSVAPGQVVDVGEQPDDPRKRRPPAEARYVSDRDHFVEKETRSRATKQPGQKTVPVPSALTAAAPPQPATPRGAAGTARESVAAQAGPKGPKVAAAAPAASALQDLARVDGPGDFAAGKSEKPAAAPGGGLDGQLSAGQRDPRLALSPSTLARLAGGPSNDYLKGVEEGDGTFLNTREWKYATYFNRIKESVSSAWDVQRTLDQRDPDRSIYAFKDRFTLLSVTLDDKGGVKDLAVVKTSNVEFLDRTAVDAFRKAQPFANPPPGLVDAGGEIRFNFGFYLEVGRPGIHLFRGPTP
jgi:TonB family protein